jgi:RNA-directed DNA polymerase
MSALKLNDVSTKQERIATLAKQSPQMGFTSLAYLIDLDWLREAYRRTRKDAAAGVDGQTAEGYAADLETNLQSLLDRAKSGLYKAPAVRRVHIPKGTGHETRPIGIPTFEDKVLQRAVAIMGGWVVEIDIQKFFDTMDHGHLREFVSRRVRDGVLKRLIGKWLNAGVLEEGRVTYPEAGSPQGGVISPILSNLYLHHVLDDWFETEVKPRMAGQAFLIRYADDAVMGFSKEEDARRVLDVLPKRFARYGLTLHPTKTRLVRFVRSGQDEGPKGPGSPPDPETFDLLGFTHYWSRSLKGHWVIKRKTAKSRFTRAVRAVSQWCKTHRHAEVRDQHQTLVQKLRGHYAYYGITCNGRALARFRHEVKRIWKKWLSRRSQRSYLDWPKYLELLKRYPLPPPVVVHSACRPQQNHDPKSRMR